MTPRLATDGKAGLPRRRTKRAPRYVESSEFLSMVGRIVTAAGRRVGEADAADLAQLVAIRRTLDSAIIEAVRGLRSSGYTWQQIGDVMGVTRQAVLMRFNPLLGGQEDADAVQH